MKIGITGASGFLGRHLVARLKHEDHELILLKHRQSGATEDDGIRHVQGLINDIDSLQEFCKGVDVIYHLVGLIVEIGEQTFKRVVVEGTENLIEASRKTGVKRIIYISAMGTGESARSKYHQAKYRAEETIKASGIDYVILRPSVIYGPGDGFVSLLTSMIKKAPMVPVIGSGRYKMQPVYIDDLINVMVEALESEQVVNQIFDVGGPEQLEYVEMLDLVKSKLDKKRLYFHIPVFIMQFMAGILEKILKPAPITRDQLLMMQAGNIGQIENTKRMFNFDPIRFADGLDRYLR